MRRLAFAALLAAGSVFVVACGGGEADQASSPTSTPETATTRTSAGQKSGGGGVDPRKDGFEVALGEWALTPEAEAIRPGRAVFVITNRGTMPHGFEIEREGDDPSGSGSGDDRGKVETRVLQPGETVEVELDLSAGVYKLECNVDGHDDMGMEMLLDVRRDAPLAKAAKTAAGSADAVGIEAFAFTPATVEVQAGQEVVWKNHDPADHTVTEEGGGFDSGTLASGGTFKTTFDQPGEYRYICALHPGMKGRVVVTG
jgi:plastocyanin